MNDKIMPDNVIMMTKVSNLSEAQICEEKAYRRGFDHGYDAALSIFKTLLGNGMETSAALEDMQAELSITHTWKLSVDDDVKKGRNIWHSYGHYSTRDTAATPTLSQPQIDRTSGT